MPPLVETVTVAPPTLVVDEESGASAQSARTPAADLARARSASTFASTCGAMPRSFAIASRAGFGGRLTPRGVAPSAVLRNDSRASPARGFGKAFARARHVFLPCTFTTSWPRLHFLAFASASGVATTTVAAIKVRQTVKRAPTTSRATFSDPVARIRDFRSPPRPAATARAARCSVSS